MATTVLKTVKSSGGDYTSLSAWAASISGRGADLTTRDVVERVECYPISGGDTTAVSISGITTDATRRLEIATPSSNRHGGKWNTAAYFLSTTNAAPLTIAAGHIVIDGLQFKSLPTYSSGVRGVFYTQVTTAANPYCYFLNCIVGESNAYNTGPAFACNYTSSGSTATVVAASCLVHSAAGIATGFSNNNVNRCSLYCYNCTVKIGGTGFTNVTTKNCLANGVTDGFNNCTGDYNVSSVSSDAPGSNSRTGNAIFVDSANYDFHLSDSDTVAKGYGTNLSSDSIYALTKDIDDQTITTWSIGADGQVGTTSVEVTVTLTVIPIAASATSAEIAGSLAASALSAVISARDAGTEGLVPLSSVSSLFYAWDSTFSAHGACDGSIPTVAASILNIDFSSSTISTCATIVASPLDSVGITPGSILADTVQANVSALTLEAASSLAISVAPSMVTSTKEVITSSQILVLSASVLVEPHFQTIVNMASKQVILGLS